MAKSKKSEKMSIPQSVKEIGLYAIVGFTALTLSVFIPIQLVIIHEVVGRHLSKTALNVITWIATTWMFWFIASSGFVVGIRAIEKKKRKQE